MVSSKTFRARVFWSIIPMVVIVFVLLGTIDFYQQRRLAEEEFTQRLQTTTLNLAEFSRVPVLAGDTQRLKSIMENITGTADFVHVRVYDERGRALFSKVLTSIDLPVRNDAESDDPRITLQQQAPLALPDLYTKNGTRVMQFLAPITMDVPANPYELEVYSRTNTQPSTTESPKHVIGAIQLGLSLQSIDTHFANILKWRIYLFSVFLILSTAAIYILSGRITRPITSLTTQVDKITEGDFDQQISVTTRDEIGKLTARFNDMTRSLKTLYSGLEQKVEERTRQLTVANDKLAAVNEHKTRFLANVNHELRTPVSAIIGYGRLLRRKAAWQLTTQESQYIDDLLNNAERLLNQIDSLLDLAKIESGTLQVAVEPVMVEDLVSASVATIAPILNSEQVRLAQSVAPALPVLHTDRDKLRQVLLNLLGNAVKFTEHGEIKIAAVADNGNLKMAVSDTGSGIRPQDLPRIFEPYQRGEPVDGAQQRGVGLGLAISKQLVQLLGGEISVQSQPGCGSTFTVTLPWSLEPPAVSLRQS